MIDVADYTDLAWYFANNSNKRYLQGVDIDDIYQAAMIGIWQASQTYDCSVGAFTTYAHLYMTGEVNNLIYRTTKKDGKTTRTPRITETLLSDITTDEDCIEQSTHEDDLMDREYIEKYLLTLKLRESYKTFFFNMILYGDKEATIMYMDKHKVSKQRAHQVKKVVRDIAKKHLEKLT